LQTKLVTFMGRTSLSSAYQELIGTTDLIQNAGVDWTIVRFTAPKNTPKSGKLRVGFYGTNRIGFAVSRADLAAFTFEQTSGTSPPTQTSWSSPFCFAGSPTCRCHLSPTASSST
jgi:hypothetical protein